MDGWRPFGRRGRRLVSTLGDDVTAARLALWLCALGVRPRAGLTTAPQADNLAARALSQPPSGGSHVGRVGWSAKGAGCIGPGVDVTEADVTEVDVTEVDVTEVDVTEVDVTDPLDRSVPGAEEPGRGVGVAEFDPIPEPALWAEVAKLEAELEADLVRDLEADLGSPDAHAGPAAADGAFVLSDGDEADAPAPRVSVVRRSPVRSLRSSRRIASTSGCSSAKRWRRSRARLDDPRARSI